jgi:hypothetical protein
MRLKTQFEWEKQEVHMNFGEETSWKRQLKSVKRKDNIRMDKTY